MSPIYTILLLFIQYMYPRTETLFSWYAMSRTEWRRTMLRWLLKTFWPKKSFPCRNGAHAEARACE